MNEFKERKLAEFQDKFYDTIAGEPDTEEGIFIKIPKENCHTEIKQFISDLIDEIVGAIPEPKNETYIVNCIQYKDKNAKSWNDCRVTLIDNLNNK